MLLACPICQAQYEVPEDAIPEAGCEVQCSACGETWFQPHPQASFPIENIRGDQRLQDFAYIKGAIEHNSESQSSEPSNRDLQSPIFNNPTAIQRPPSRRLLQKCCGRRRIERQKCAQPLYS